MVVAGSRIALIGAGGALAILVGCAGGGGAALDLNANASGSSYFSLSRPSAYKAATGMVLAGRVCRRARTTVLSPPRVRLERVGLDGAVLETASATVGPIYRNGDQPCARYSRRLAWSMPAGESVRACFDRGGPCAPDAPTKSVPAPGALPPAPTSSR
jgi:hypothetical protein